MNIKEKSEQYARERWGIFYKEPYPVIASDKSIGEISAKDYTNGYNEAKRWIQVGERLPSKDGHYLVKVAYSFPKNCKVVIAEFEI